MKCLPDIHNNLHHHSSSLHCSYYHYIGHFQSMQDHSLKLIFSDKVCFIKMDTLYIGYHLYFWILATTMNIGITKKLTCCAIFNCKSNWYYIIVCFKQNKKLIARRDVTGWNKISTIFAKDWSTIWVTIIDWQVIFPEMNIFFFFSKAYLKCQKWSNATLPTSSTILQFKGDKYNLNE